MYHVVFPFTRLLSFATVFSIELFADFFLCLCHSSQNPSIMLLKLTGERQIFSAINKDNATHFFVSWEVSSTLPIGAPKNIASLKKLLKRAVVDDIVFFLLDMNTAEPTTEVIDPSMSCYDHRLADGAFVYLSCNPMRILGAEALANLSTAASLPWVPLSSSALHFKDVGSAVEIVGKNRRTVVKRAPSGWGRSIALCDHILANDEINKWSFRIRFDPDLALTTADVESTNDAPSRSATVTPVAATPQAPTPTTEAAAAEDDLESEASRTQRSDREDTRSRASSMATNAQGTAALKAREGFRLQSPDGSAPLPIVAIGVADVDVPLDEDEKQHGGGYPACYMLDISTGSFFSGTESRPSYVDSHEFKYYSGMVLTFAVDTEAGCLNIIQQGKVILVAPIPKYVADSLQPCVELYTQGAVVELC